MTAVERVLIVVPAHNEEELLPGCLTALEQSIRAIALPACIVVVLDACTDATASVVGSRARTVVIDRSNVGAARAAGFAAAGRRCGAETWFATTDADTAVGPGWLQAQLRHAAAGQDMVLGTVTVAGWQDHNSWVRERYLRGYLQRDGHRHVHGANLGMRADSYWSVGGFTARASGEDVDLVHRFVAARKRVSRTAELPVQTSARRVGRAPEGFAAHLRDLDLPPHELVS